jgi:hypothetical protein
VQQISADAVQLSIKEQVMKILQIVTFPHEAFNASIRDDTAAEKINRILEAIKPEAVYFTEHNGKRGAVLIVDLPDPAKIPALSEPWFLAFNADVHFQVAMTPTDLKNSGLGELGKKWG